jgi:hypothetical protein
MTEDPSRFVLVRWARTCVCSENHRFLMPNRQLTKQELQDIFAPLIALVRHELIMRAAGDAALHWALRRKLAKELGYDERGKPGLRKLLKQRKLVQQDGKCPVCSEHLPARGAVLDRFEAMRGYNDENTRLICPTCDVEIQASRRFA